MAMTDGGLIALGVDDGRNLIGCPPSQGLLDRVTRIAHECGVEVRLRPVTVGRVQVTLVGVPDVRGRIVTTPDGRLLRRIGSSNQPLRGDALARFVRERENRSAEEEGLPLADLKDFDLDLVNRALAADERPKTRGDGLPRALVDLGVARVESPPAGYAVSLAAALLFARDPRKYVVGASVQLVRRTGVAPGPGPTQARADVSGPIPELVDKVLAFLSKHTTQHEAVVGARREPLPEYPVAVLREAVLNALAHRDYGLTGATVDITVWDDRVEIRSPGALPGHITVDNIREEHYSRNRRVMHVLKLLGLVEEYGEGVDRMFREMEARLLEPPAIVASPSSVTITLRNRSLLSVEEQAWLGLLGHLDIAPAERRILVLARQQGAVTPRSVRSLMGEVDAEALLSGAVAKGLLVLTGRRGGARYVLSDEVVLRAGATGVEARARQRQRLLDEIQRRGSLSTAEAMEILGEANPAVVRHVLNDLARGKRIVARGQTRARRYHQA